jgi:hypothetical protein
VSRALTPRCGTTPLTTRFAPRGLTPRDRGDYKATIVVPEGGISDVQIGLTGWRTDASGTRRADAFFPITNDPVPGGRRLSSPTLADASPLPWAFVLGGVALLAVLAVVFARRRPLGCFG